MFIARRRTVGIAHAQPAADATTTAPPYLGALLVATGQLTSDQLALALDRQHRTSQRLGQTLIDMEFVSPDSVLDGLSRQYGVRSTRVNAYTVSAESVATIPERIARRHVLMPLLAVGATLLVGMARPNDAGALDAGRSSSGCELEPLVALEGEIRQAIARYYGRIRRPEVDEVTDVVIGHHDRYPPARGTVAEPSAARFVDRLLARALENRVSDIHFVPSHDSVLLRLRIDGRVLEITHLLPTAATSVLARVKHLAGLDASDRGNPQNGEFNTRVGTHTIGARVATYPTIWGELVRVTPGWGSEAAA